MEKLGQYTLSGHLTNENAGYSMWGFGQKNGKDYFIKQFLSPKYPHNDTVSTPEQLAKKVAKCDKFISQKRKIYEVLNRCSDGNDVRVCELFRVESKFYITMDKIVALPWGVEDVVALPLNERIRLCAIIAHAIAALHQGGIVHSDLKHENVLFTYTANGSLTAKVIDFDSSFLESDPPGDGEKIVGDFHYFSPEACASLNGMPATLTCKMDVFALGVLFHQYLSGDSLKYDQEGYLYAGEAVLNGCNAVLSSSLSPQLQSILQPMFSLDPALRPAAMDVYRSLAKLAGMVSAAPVVDPVPIRRHTYERTVTVPRGGDPFFTPGDLL